MRASAGWVQSFAALPPARKCQTAAAADPPLEFDLHALVRHDDLAASPLQAGAFLVHHPLHVLLELSQELIIPARISMPNM